MIGWEANASRMIQSEVLDEFDGRARISAFEINFDAEPIEVSATVLTPVLLADIESRGSDEMSRKLGAPVNFNITQYQVGTSASAAEEAQLAAARAQEAAAIRRADELGARP